jgi:EGF-like domain
MPKRVININLISLVANNNNAFLFTRRLGPRCEISVCENNPCQAGGTCLVHPGTNFVCLCPLGREGIFCEKGLNFLRKT